VSPAARLLVIIGSGEMAPRMARVQRSVIRRLAGQRGRASDVRATIIDTPYGFQSNADALSAAALDFFGRRLGVSATIASFRRADDLLGQERAVARIAEADLVFGGPGSPSYALHQWSGSPIAQALADKLTTNGSAVIVASAAALTIGRLTLPVYEIYKAGKDPFWLPGLDLLSTIGIGAAVIPHYDNAEGASHDTRYCFIGEERLIQLERQLPDDVFILGVDEHTALVFDLEAERASVAGLGGVTVRRDGRSLIVPAGAEIALSELRRSPSGRLTSEVARPEVAVPSDEASTLARRLVDLEERAAAVADQAGLVEPLIDALLELRTDARARGDWRTADEIRARLLALGIEIADRPDGATTYRLASSA
jgi:cyanophycinase-like exopeptidase